MSSRSRGRIEVLCEDDEHESFIVALLRDQFGLQRRSIHVEKAPSGFGSAAGWVVQNYDRFHLRAKQTKQSQLGLGFLVTIDGDGRTVDERIAELDKRATLRDPGARIAIWVPSRNIATWVKWLCGEPVNETTNYKYKVDFFLQIKEAVRFWEPPREGESSAVPSLSAGREEIRRLPIG